MVIILLFCAQFSVAQSPMKWEDFVQNLYDEDAETDNDTYEELYALHLNPINLNDTDEQHLLALPFLTPTQAKSIVDYVKKNYPMRSLGELMLIPGIDYITRMQLQLFCSVGNEKSDEEGKDTDKWFSGIKHEVVGRTDIPFYKKEGYRHLPDSILAQNPNRVYQGTANYLSLRYKLSGSDHLSAGIQAEKDAGERGLDYVSAYAMLRNVGAFRSVIAGDYKLSFGQGLVVNNGMSFGKIASINSLAYMNRGIRPHSSMAEYNHLRGVAADLNLTKTLHFTAFFSHRKVDATASDDSHTSVSSLKTDGLHRTQLERSKRGMLTETTYGGHVQFDSHGFTAGFTCIGTHFSIPLQPRHDTPSTRYRLYNLHGDEFGAMSLSYGYAHSRYSFLGETAVSLQNGTMATTNTARYNASRVTSFSLTLRSFDKRYATLYGRTLSENSMPQNESGLLLGVKTEPVKKVYVESYVDVFHFPYSKSDASAGSNGLEWHTQVSYMPREKSMFQLRYRLKSKQKDCKLANNTTALYYFTTQNLRLQHTLQASNSLTLRSTISLTHLYNPDAKSNAGCMVSEHIRWNPSGRRNRIDLMATYFNTDSYASRLYTSEPSLLYAMGMSAVYYHGMRLIGMATVELMPKVYVSAKLATTHYFDRNTIGSGLELINNSHREDLSIQVRSVF